MFASQVRLRVEPTRRQERQGPSEEQRTAGAIHHNPLTAEHTTADAWEEPSTRLSVLTRAEALARLDRRRKKRTSNKDWANPSDPDAKITKMKDGRTHLAPTAEHAVDLGGGALVAVTLHGADVGDTTSLVETAIAAAEQVEAAHAASATRRR